jgi:antitoxin component YwqK of YwqJK toxin-antitoxin module
MLMRHYLLVLLLSIQLASCINPCQENIESIKITKEDGLYQLQIDSLSIDIYVNSNGELGQLIVKRDSLSVKKEINIFFEQEKLSRIENSLNGELHGSQFGFDQNGKLWVFDSYYHGLEFGKSLIWDKNTNVIVEGFYRVHEGDSMLKDTAIDVFSPDGKRFEGTLECRKQWDGKWEYRYSNGLMKRVEHYNNGKRVGHWKFYDATGKITNTIDYDKHPFVPPKMPWE